MGRVVRLASEGIFVTTEEAKRISITSHNCNVLPPLNLNIYMLLIPFFATMPSRMTNYHINATNIPSYAAEVAKAQRKNVLEAVRKQRIQQEQERRKRQQNVYSTSDEYREYQEMLKEEASLYR